MSELGDQRSPQETPAARTDSEALFAQPTLAVQRRTVLRTAGLLALASAGAAALAGCSADAETGTPSATPATTPAPGDACTDGAVANRSDHVAGAVSIENS